LDTTKIITKKHPRTRLAKYEQFARTRIEDEVRETKNAIFGPSYFETKFGEYPK